MLAYHTETNIAKGKGTGEPSTSRQSFNQMIELGIL